MPAGWYPDPAGSGARRYWDGAGWGQLEGAPPPATAPAPTKRGVPLVLKIALGVVLAFVLMVGGCAALIGFAANEGSKELDRQRAEAIEEVAVETCASAEFAGAEAVGVARNGSSERSNYWIEVSFLAADGTVLDTGYADVQNVEPGGVGRWTAVAFAEAAERVANCEVVDVTRMAS
jgi:hypothetical protein